MTKNEADFEIWREQRDRDAYQRAKSIRMHWDALGGLNRFLTGPLWDTETATEIETTTTYVAASLSPVNRPRLDSVFAAIANTPGLAIAFDYRQGNSLEDLFGPNYRSLTVAEHAAAFERPAARAKLAADYNAIKLCDVCVLVHPCNRSAHFEAGLAHAWGKPVIIMFDGPQSAELLYGAAAAFVSDIPQLLNLLTDRAWIDLGRVRLGSISKVSCDERERPPASPAKTSETAKQE